MRTASATPTSDADFAFRPLRSVIVLVACSLSLFQLYTSGIEPLGLFHQRSIHLGMVLILVYLIYPWNGPGRPRGAAGWVVDGMLVISAGYSAWYLSWNLDEIIERAGFWSQQDIIVGALAVLTLLEASRRVLGLTITLIAGLMIVYGLAGSGLPGFLQHRGYSLERIIAQLYLGQEGIYGVPLGVAATYVFIFVLFGAFLQVTGAGRFFIDLAYSVAGRRRGGPAKVAVVSSAFMGSLSGSAVANVVTSGSFTIPLMKRLGYKPDEAGGIEAAASTGGQIMPPVMGAGAFLIAEYTGTSYLEVVKLSILPALMYFATVYLFVDIIAARRGMSGLPSSQLPRLGTVFREGGHFLIPLGVLIYFLLQGMSPGRVGFLAVTAVTATALTRALLSYLTAPSEADHGGGTTLHNGVHLGVRALETGARNALPVSVACAVAGIIVGMVGLTGLGLKFSSMMLSLSMGMLGPAVLLVGVASLILGIGLPVTASYIVLAVLTAPALVNEFGVPVLLAHLLIFWYSQDSNVTPPVALAAFAAAAVAGSDPMRTGLKAWKYAKGLYLIPLFLVFNPEIIVGGPWLLVLWNAVTAVAALGAFAAVLEGYLFAPLGRSQRVLAAVGTVAIFYPGLPVEAAGLLLIAGVLLHNRLLGGR